MYDLIVIGAGPGGYNAAVFAAQNGLKTAVIEKSELGGICLNWGCIPTKSLLKATEHIYSASIAKEWGINIPAYSVDLDFVIEQSRATVKKLTSGINHLFKKNNVTLIQGHAKINKLGIENFEIICNKEIYKTKHIIIASGARQRKFPNIEFSEKVWSVKEAMQPSFIPEKICIVGAGAIGIEFANFYSILGSKVTIFEIADKILANTDKQISQTLQSQMQKNGVKFNLKQGIDKIEENKDHILVHYSNIQEKFDALIVAIGVIPNSEDFQDHLTTQKGYITTNANHETNIKNIFAIGDCTAPPWLAHKATHEGIRAVKKILGKTLRKMPAVPMCIYTTPQVASIGLNEEEIQEETVIGIAHFSANGKAVAIKETNGLIKLIFAKKTGEILGAHMIGPEVTELIHSVALGMQLECLIEDFCETIFPHPTLSETLYEAAMDAYIKMQL